MAHTAAIVESEKMSPHDSATCAVGGQDDRSFLVAAGDDLEQGGGVLGGHGQISQFVDYENCRAGEEPHCVAAQRPSRADIPARLENWQKNGRLGQRRWCSKPCAHHRPRRGPR